jgi:hypothetical protein
MGYEIPPPVTMGLSALVGALVLVDVHSYEPRMASSFGDNKEGIVATVTVVDFPADPSHVGEVLMSIPVLNTGIVMSLRQAVGRTVLGRLVAKQTRAGQSPAVILNDPSPADMALTDAFLAGRPMTPPQQPQSTGYPQAPAPYPAQPPAPPTWPQPAQQAPPAPPSNWPPANPGTQPPWPPAPPAPGSNPPPF